MSGSGVMATFDPRGSGAGRCGSANIAYATDCPLLLQIASLSVDLLVDSYLHTTQHGCCSL